MRSPIQTKMFALIKEKPSDKSVRDFCKAKDIKESSYFYWRKKSTQQPNSSSLPAFLPIVVTEAEAAPGIALASIQLPGGAVITVFNAAVFSFIQSLR